MKKRRLLSIVLSLCMVLALMPQMVFADDTQELKALLEDADGIVKLEKDYTISETVVNYANFTLDLNGHVVRMTGSGGVFVFAGVVTLMDSDPNATHTGENASLPAGGVITGGKNASHGGGVLTTGIFTMNGGTITNCSAENGGGVYTADNFQFTMNGGTIEGCTANENGQAFYLSRGSFIIANGGTVKGTVYFEEGSISKGESTGCTKFYDRVTINNGGAISYGIFYGGISGSGTVEDTCHTVSFDLNGGDGSVPTQYFVGTGTAQALKPADPTKEGYEFTGWYTDKELTKPYDFDSAVNEDITLYAGFEPLTYTVTYDSGEGEGSIEAGTKTHGENFILSSKTFTREGYIQTGWMDENGAEYDFGDTYTEDSDVTLYPVWDKIVTLKVPFTTTVKLGGNVSPGETTFDLAVVDIKAAEESHKDVSVTGSVTTNGAGDYKGNMIFTGPSQQLRAMFCEGAFVQQVNAGEDGWTYDDTVWGLVWQDDIVALASADDAATEYSVNIFPAKYEKSENGIFYSINEGEKPVDNMSFQNTYTKSVADPSDPEGTTNGDSDNDSKADAEDSAKTGDDANLALWLALMLLAGAGITGTTIYTRRKRTNE